MKLVKEVRKIWKDKDVKVTKTCIRVPVMHVHVESVDLQFEKSLDEDTTKRILKGGSGVVVFYDHGANRFPHIIGDVKQRLCCSWSYLPRYSSR